MLATGTSSWVIVSSEFFFSYNPIKYKWFLNRCIWPINGTLTGTTIPGNSGPKSNNNEEVLSISQISKTRASPSDAV